jgi:hypothetical protein
VYPALYDGFMNVVAEFPVEGYAVHADLLGVGHEQIIIYTDEKAYIFSSREIDPAQVAAGRSLPQPKRLYSSTLYPGGEAG